MDGVLENPRACTFDYAALQCRGGDEPTCLTAEQVQSARVLATPFRDPAGGDNGRVLLVTPFGLAAKGIGAPRPARSPCPAQGLACAACT